MPVMNGWEFLREFQNIENNKKNTIVVLMIGTKLNAVEASKIGEFPQVVIHNEKMLTQQTIADMVRTYFSQSSVLVND